MMSHLLFPPGFGFMFIFMIIATVFWIWMLVDCVTRKFTSQVEKIAWVLGMLFFHVIISIVYYFAVKKSNPTGVMKTP